MTAPPKVDEYGMVRVTEATATEEAVRLLKEGYSLRLPPVLFRFPALASGSSEPYTVTETRECV